MTKQECAVLMAHTGTVLLQGDDLRIFYEYVKHLLKRPVHTHELPLLADEIKEKSREDFENILSMAVDLDEILGEFDLCEGCPGEECGLFDECEDECEKDKCDFYKKENNSSSGRLDEFNELPFEDTEFDSVNHPIHYQSDKGIEVIDVIEAFTTDLCGIEAVCAGNVIKYICRWPYKNGIEDLKKAEWYLRRLIQEVESF